MARLVGWRLIPATRLAVYLTMKILQLADGYHRFLSRQAHLIGHSIYPITRQELLAGLLLDFCASENPSLVPIHDTEMVTAAQRACRLKTG